MTTKPDDITQDVWDTAEEAMRRYGWKAPSMIEGAARAIIDYREIMDINHHRPGSDPNRFRPVRRDYPSTNTPSDRPR